MGKERVVIGMSGGVDSFVAALLLRERGYEVVGVHLELWGESDLEEVEAVCRRLSIPLTVCAAQDFFRRQVVDDFVRSYRMGLTPSPCCICNSLVKWDLLEQEAVRCGATRIATGHYVRVEDYGGRPYFFQGIDRTKDQSYFLWGVPSRILAKALSPLGDYTKREVKEWAVWQGYERVAARRESMGVCFLRGSDYRDFLRREGGGMPDVPGDIVTRQGGKVVGRHGGLADYTVGQRRGIPAVEGMPLYVAEIDVDRNVVVVDTKASLYTDTFCIDRLNVVAEEDLQAADLTVKVRGIGLNPQGAVWVERLAGGVCRVHLAEPAWAVAPGQPAAFFRGERLVGGGIVCRDRNL